jgi:alpha-amylase
LIYYSYIASSKNYPIQIDMTMLPKNSPFSSWKRPLSWVVGLIFLVSFSTPLPAQKVVLQGFWWDYWNNNYPNAWANYLSDLSPRLKVLGVDAVWVPPSIKNGNQGDGYSPFDDYDLGDKYQKNILKTRSGNKNELLRMVAVLHANGIGVVQDIVLNHLDNAGSANGSGGQDPAAWDDGVTSKYKNFRYSSFLTPATNESAQDYLSRQGRFSKNWQNFHPTAVDNSVTGDWNVVLFGPDISYVKGAAGLSSNAIYNPVQDSNYMRNETRKWCTWYKKQMGFDGGRYDAVKNYPYWAVEDFIYNLQHNSGWASGGDNMFSVGEFVGSASEIDQFENNVNNRAGTFDFALRDGIYKMVSGGGGFDLGTIPGYQQTNRFVTIGGNTIYRTCPFVNSHDSFRPQVDASGNYTGWNTGNELIPHINPFDDRLSAAYAIAFAVDGNPIVFFEDLFDVGGTGKRYAHLPQNPADLPVRSDIANLIWCHQNLHFKSGAYKVRFQAADHLVIERSAKAIIGINDNYTAWQNNYVLTDFAPGVQLKDYSGANGTAVLTVDASGGVNINTPPCNGTASMGRKGYSVWAPVNAVTNFSPSPYPTSQEWEMANDLGDSHANSLGQGGALPASSTTCRTVGSIFACAGTAISLQVFPTDTSGLVHLDLYRNSTLVYSQQGKGTFTGNYLASDTSWYTAVIRNATVTDPGQTVFVKLTYSAPAICASLRFPSPGNAGCLALTTGLTESSKVQNGCYVYPNPTSTGNLNIVISSREEKTLDIFLYASDGKLGYCKRTKVYAGNTDIQLLPEKTVGSGLYYISIPELGIGAKVILH